MRVLIAEDEPRLAEALARGLRRNGCAVDVSHDGRSALDRTQLVDYDAIVLALAGLTPGFFPRWVEPGEVIGAVHAAGAAASGLPGPIGPSKSASVSRIPSGCSMTASARHSR